MPFITIQAQVAHLFEHKDFAIYSDTDEACVAGSIKNVAVFSFLTSNLRSH